MDSEANKIQWGDLIRDLGTDPDTKRQVDLSDNLSNHNDVMNPLMKKAIKCCNGSVTTPSLQRYCVSLLQNDNCTSDTCNTIVNEYCTDTDHTERLLETQCKKFLKTNLDKVDLRAVCKDKVGNEDWESICACYYPAKKYQSLAKKIAE